MDVLYATDQTFYELNYASSNVVYISLPDSSSTCGSWLSQLPSLPSGWSYRCSADPTNIDGTGWIPIPFSNFPTLNIPKLFIDPINKPPYYYSFVVGGSYEVNAKLESRSSLAVNDNGDDIDLFEAGTDLSLHPPLFKNFANSKVLVIEQEQCSNTDTTFVNQLINLGLQVVVDTSVTTIDQVRSYNPDIVAALDRACAVNNPGLINQLFNAGYKIYTSGNDNNNSLLIIKSSVITSVTAGTIVSLNNHWISKGWSTTGGSGSDGRHGITSIIEGAVPLYKDNTNNFIEGIYYDYPNKGRWFHHQPNSAPNSELIRRATQWLLRTR
jgi:hypothetical protein